MEGSLIKLISLGVTMFLSLPCQMLVKRKPRTHFSVFMLSGGMQQRLWKLRRCRYRPLAN